MKIVKIAEALTNKVGPIPILSITVIFTCFIFFKIIDHTSTNQRKAINSIKEEVDLERKKMEIAYLIEVMTSSINIAHLSRQSNWINRYKSNAQLLNRLVEETIDFIPNQGNGTLKKEVLTAKNKFTEYENKAIQFVENKEYLKANDILNNIDYKNQKRLFKNGIDNLTDSKKTNIRLIQLRGKALILDEILSMSALSAAFNNNPQWEESYNFSATELEKVIAESISLTNSKEIKNALALTSEANDKLIDLEIRSFFLSKQNNPNKAQELLRSQEYIKNKEIYSEGMEYFSKALNTQIDKLSEDEKEFIRTELVLITISCLFLVFSWAFVWWSVIFWKNKLSKKNAELEEFSYRTSHDLKAPLVNIRGLSKLMKEDLEDGDYIEVLSNIEKISALSLKLESLVGEIVEVARMDSENGVYEEVDIAKEVESIKENLNTLKNENQVDVQLSLNGNKAVWTQRNLIQRVLGNLISNAIKYSDPEKTHKFVKVEVSETKEGSQIQVIDNGLGIPEEYSGEVFGMFKRFHKSSSFGSGLGLYLVKKSLEKINGKISFQSSLEGTVFTIVLPAIQSAPQITH
jgi:signal transduction histidine kinase